MTTDSELKSDLSASVKKIFQDTWSTWSPESVPDPEDIALGNEAAEFERATVLYADLASSTNMVDQQHWQFAAEIYKTFLYCATKMIKHFDGAITSYDGDRVMGVFIGDSQSTDAAICALKINWAVKELINPALKLQYPSKSFTVRQVVGVDTSPIRAARTGVRGDNDIVWVGRAANYAAKLTAINNTTVGSWVTEAVYNQMNAKAKFKDPDTNPVPMWKSYKWDAFGDKPIYGSTWHWAL